MPKNTFKIIITVILVIVGISIVKSYLKFSKLGYNTGSSMIYMFIILALVITYIWTKPDILKKAAKDINEPQLITKAKEGDVNACKLLLDENADVNQQDDKGATALIYAVLNTDVAIITLLLSKGADTSIATNKGLTPNAIAKNNNMITILEILNKNHT